MPSQNQNTRPDFSFITQQQAPQPKKRGDKKLIIIIALLVLLVVMIAVVALAPKKEKTNTGTVNANTGVPAESAETAVKNYLAAVNAEKYEEAYSYFSPTSGVEKERYLNASVKLFKISHNLANCTSSVADASKPTVVTVNCPNGDNSPGAASEYIMVKTNTGYLIQSANAQEKSAP